jgi:hypothetical protein
VFNFLGKQKFPTILLFFGVVLVFAGFFDIKDITKLSITANSKANYTIAVFGGLLVAISILIYLFDELTLGWLGFSKISKNDLGFGTKISTTTINILFGRLETLSENSEESMVVLPANEFFDDECIRDNKSALGAYINHKFTNQDKQIEELISSHLQDYKCTEIEKEVGVTQKSYGVGEGVFLKKPLGSSQPILFIAATTKRAKEGLRAEMSYIFQAMRKIQHIAADNRINSAYIPIMGSGHGGLKKEVALFALLLAVCDSITKPNGHHLKTINIVIFQSDEKEKPLISRMISKRLLRIATGMYS